MTGIMVQPIRRTAKLAIWPVIAEVVLLNMVLIFIVCSVQPIRDAGVIHDKVQSTGTLSAGEQEIKEHILEVVADHHVGPVFAGAAAIIFGLLLLSATNTAVIGMISIQYAMSRNRELPARFSWLNGYGVPYYALLVAILVPLAVTLLAQDLAMLASLYAIGVVGAIIINLGSCAHNPKLDIRSWERKAMWAIAGVLAAVWITLATNLVALAFIAGMLGVGMMLRFVTQRVPVPARVPAAAAVAGDKLPPLLPFDPGK
ncbi:MAG: amino acid permease, partial [Phycisphaerae bacterium]|nr:amino acid permease [Phycisphaerae bacterium]